MIDDDLMTMKDLEIHWRLEHLAAVPKKFENQSKRNTKVKFGCSKLKICFQMNMNLNQLKLVSDFFLYAPVYNALVYQ